MTYEKPILSEKETSHGTDWISIQIGSLGTLSLSGGKLLKIEEIPITDKRLQTAWEHELYRILVTATNPEVEMRIC